MDIKRSPSTENLNKSLEELLDNHEALAEVFEKIKFEEFAELLFALFDSHNQLTKLLKCAIDKNLSDLSSPVDFIIDQDSILYEVFSLLLHNDLGRRYMQLIFLPLFKDCIEFVSTDLNEDTHVSDSWIASTTHKFLLSVNDSAQRCPIAFRESLGLLHEALEQKFSTNGNYLIARVVFSQFFCPAIEKRTCVEKTKEMELSVLNSKRCNRVLNKIVQHIQTIAEGRDPNLKEEFNHMCSFVSKLMDKDDIESLKEVIESNVIVDFEKKRRDSMSRMEQYLKEGKRKETLQVHFQLEELKSNFTSILQDQEGWTIDAIKKKHNIVISWKKYDWSPIYVWKIQTIVRTSMNKFHEIMEELELQRQKDSKYKVYKYVNKEENRKDIYLRTFPSFPVAARDFLITQHSMLGDKKSFFLSYSITNNNFPKFPKVVRAQLYMNGIFAEANDSGDEIMLTGISHYDLKGTVATQMKWEDETVKDFKKIHELSRTGDV